MKHTIIALCICITASGTAMHRGKFPTQRYQNIVNSLQNMEKLLHQHQNNSSANSLNILPIIKKEVETLNTEFKTLCVQLQAEENKIELPELGGSS